MHRYIIQFISRVYATQPAAIIIIRLSLSRPLELTTRRWYEIERTHAPNTDRAGTHQIFRIAKNHSGEKCKLENSSHHSHARVPSLFLSLARLPKMGKSMRKIDYFPTVGAAAACMTRRQRWWWHPTGCTPNIPHHTIYTDIFLIYRTHFCLTTVPL